MQRKPGFPIANCSIKMPENGAPTPIEGTHCEDDVEHQQRRQQLINFGHSQWGFNNWSWSVTKQELDFVDFSNGKYCAGVVAFVSVTVKTIDIHRENIGYATSLAANKGFAIYKSRKCAVTNALRETLLSFGGKVASDLKETLDAARADVAPEPAPEPVLPKPEPKASPAVRVPPRKEPEINVRGAPLVANPPPVAKAHPMPAALPPPRPPAPRPPPPHLPPAPPPPQLRPNSNVSFVLQPVMPPLYAPPRLGPPAGAPHVFPNAYYECSGPWHFYESYDRPHGNVNLNFNLPPKSLVVNSRSGSVECKSACRPDELPYGPQQPPGCWIKPTIFYDGFWTEQKVKKWVAEQVEKQFPEDSSHDSSSPAAPDASKS